MAETKQVVLTIGEREQLRSQAEGAMRKRLDTRRPDAAAYVSSGNDRATRLISATLLWSKAAVPVIALLAALASAVRTLQTASEIYTASGSHPLGVILAAVAFTLSAEGALFTLALAQEGQRMKYRADKRERHVASLKSLTDGIAIRLGLRPAPRYDELPERDGLGVVMLIAFAFAVAANAYMGMRPLLAEIGANSLQDFIAGLWSAPGNVQLTFIVDLAAVLFPPFMALKAGHLTAHFAAEITEQSGASQAAYERDLATWRAAYANPLETEEGQELLSEALENKLLSKAARANSKGNGSDVPFGSPALTRAELESTLMTRHVNGSGGIRPTEN